MSSFQELVTENPMLMEVRRMQRRFMGMERANALSTVVLVLAGMAYLGLLMIVWYYRSDVDPVFLIYLQTGLYLLVGPAMLHGSIAGERERRSWDLLLVAPISKAQIVAGKFISALSALGGGALLFLLPIAIAAVSYNPSWSNGDSNSTILRFYNLLLLEGVSLSFLILVCATAIFISARCKRSFVALGGTIGTIMAALLIFPMMLAIGFASDRMTLEYIMSLHPFYVIAKVHDAANVRSTDFTENLPNWFFGWPQILTYCLFAAVLLIWAERTLRYADGEGRFITRSSNA
jgi:ABC-type transport system involved in multi-copper enzyme maturation permease subunit